MAPFFCKALYTQGTTFFLRTLFISFCKMNLLAPSLPRTAEWGSSTTCVRLYQTHTEKRKTKTAISSHSFHECSAAQELQRQSKSLLNWTWTPLLEGTVTAAEGWAISRYQLTQAWDLIQKAQLLTVKKHLTSNILNDLMVNREHCSYIWKPKLYYVVNSFCECFWKMCVSFSSAHQMTGHKQGKQPAPVPPNIKSFSMN